jgi:hypothetical protein
VTNGGEGEPVDAPSASTDASGPLHFDGGVEHFDGGVEHFDGGTGLFDAAAGSATGTDVYDSSDEPAR